MLAALALILPLGLASAVSPMMLTEQTLLLAGPGGLRAGTRFAIGAVGTVAVFVALVVLFGRAIRLPSEPHLSDSLDLVVGAGLLVGAALVVAAARRPPRPKREHRRRFGTTAALPFGVFSMATNFTTLALVVPPAKEISSLGHGLAEAVVLGVVLVALAGLPAWLPVVLTRLAPTAGARVLGLIGDLIARYGRAAVVVVLVGAGVYLVVRGLVGVL
ncbi:MAG: GAP family protein [Solirubrobacteraceae bacterium]|nr:GAP family protein [Solirubrobacteraceae bacterium]